jgi:hypothetical protein
MDRRPIPLSDAIWLPFLFPLYLLVLAFGGTYEGVRWLAIDLVPWLKLRYGKCAEVRATYIDHSGHHKGDDWCFSYQFTVDGRSYEGEMSSGYDFAHSACSGYETPELGVFTAPNAIPITYLVSDPRVHRASPPKELAAFANMPQHARRLLIGRRS